MSRLYAVDVIGEMVELVGNAQRNVVKRTCWSPHESGHWPGWPSTPMPWNGGQWLGSEVRSPPARWSQYDSTADWARTTSSSKPHLHDAHWMISSVVPTKFPVTLAYRRSFDRPATPRVWFWTTLMARTSAAGRTRAAHSASLGSGDVGGSVVKRPLGGADVVGATVVVVVGLTVVVVGLTVVVVVGLTVVVVVGAAVVGGGRGVVVVGLAVPTVIVVAARFQWNSCPQPGVKIPTSTR